MESTINVMLAPALDIISSNSHIKKGVKIDGIYESYLSQFGPMVNQLLLSSTFAVYCNKEKKGEGDRSQIIRMIFDVINKYQPAYFGNSTTYDEWIKKIMKNENDIATINEQIILDASVALKRAVRTFELEKK